MKVRIILILLAVIIAAQRTGDAQRSSTVRIPPVPVSEWTDEHRQALGQTGRGDQTIDIFKTCLRNLPLCRAWMPFTRHLLSANSVPPREKELLILRTAWLSKAVYDWSHHAGAGKRAGFTDADLLKITKGAGAGWNAADAALIRAADELHGQQHVTDATWAQLKKTYSDSQMMDIIFTVGQYMMVSMFANAAGIQLEPGFAGFPQ